ncbi:DUF4221 family protein [Peijinzhouia sedimentorum]
MKAFLYFVLFFLGFVSCNTSLTNQRIVLDIGEDIVFAIDDSTSNYSFAAQYFVDSLGNPYVFSINSNLNHLDKFDFKNKSLVQKLVLSPDNTKGIISNPTKGFKVISEDHFMIFSMNAQTIYEMDSLYNFTPFYKGDDLSRSYLNVNGTQHIQLAENGFVFPKYSSHTTYKMNVSTSVEVVDFNGESLYSIKYPSKYNQGIWGIFNSYRSYPLLLLDGSLLVSYGITDSIFRYSIDMDNKFGRPYLAKSDLLEFNKSVTRPSRRSIPELQSYEMQNGWYGQVLQDPINENIVRFVHYPIEKQAIRNGDFSSQKVGVILLDKNFNVLGEGDFPDRLGFFSYFITPQGIYFYNKEKSMSNEREMVFSKLLLDSISVSVPK